MSRLVRTGLLLGVTAALALAVRRLRRRGAEITVTEPFSPPAGERQSTACRR